MAGRPLPGVRGQRDVLFANEADIIRLGFSRGRRSTSCRCGGWHVRRVQGFTLLAFDIPAGQAAAYYPEVNPLVPLESIGDGSHTPTSKFIAIKLERARTTGVSCKNEKALFRGVQGFVIKVSDSRKSIKFHSKYSNLENCVQLVLLVGFPLPATPLSLKFASSSL
jgi:hypothetical protein